MTDEKLTAVRAAHPFVSPLADTDLLYMVQDVLTTPEERAITGEELRTESGRLAALGADGTWNGITETGVAGAALAFGELCYLQASDSRWEKATNNIFTPAGYDKKLGMCVLAAAADGDATEMLLIGKIRADAEFPTGVIGDPAYMSNTAGNVDLVPTTSAYNSIRVVGYWCTANELFFHPSPLRPRTASEIVLVHNALYGVVGPVAAAYAWPSLAITSSVSQLLGDTARLTTAIILYARWLAVWQPNAPGATVTGIRLVRFTDLGSLTEITKFERTGAGAIVVDTYDATAAIQAALAAGQQIGHQLLGDGSNAATVYTSVIEIIWG